MSKATYIIAGVSLGLLGLFLWMRQSPATTPELGPGADTGDGTGATGGEPETRVINALGLIGSVGANLYERWGRATRSNAPRPGTPPATPPQPGRMPAPAPAPTKPPVRR